MQKAKWIKGVDLWLHAFLLIITMSSCTRHDSLANQTADFSLQAGNLYQSFAEKEVASTEKYMGKVLDVIGTIQGLSTTKDGTIILMLETNDAGAIYCNFPKKSNVDMSKIVPGETIRIKGICSRFLHDLQLDHCVLAKPEKS